MNSGKSHFSVVDITRFLVLMVFLVSPLYLPHGYILALEDKTFIVWLGIIITLIMIICYGVSSGVAFLRRHSALGYNFFSGLSLSGFDALDIMVAFFGGIVAISCLFSEWKKDSFLGNGCWNVGGALILCLCALYFFCSLTMKCERIDYAFILFGGSGVMITGLLNELSVDVFGSTAGMDEIWKPSFISTIGNIDVYSSYLSVLIPVFAVAFMCAENRIIRCCFGAGLYLGFTDLYLTRADSMYFSVLFGMGLFSLWCLCSRARIRNWLIVLWIFAAGVITGTVLAKLDPDICLDEITPFLIKHHFHMIISAVCLILTLFALYVDRNFTEDTCRLILRISFWMCLAIYAGVCVAAIAYSIRNFRYEFLNRRGLIWTLAFRAFAEGGFKEKLIGLGPGNLDRFALNYRHLILHYYGDIYDLENAHNGFLEYLATTGILGAVSYLGMFVSVFVKLIRRIKGKKGVTAPMILAAAGILGYAAQDVMNGPHPMMTAMLFGFLIMFRRSVLAVSEARK